MLERHQGRLGADAEAEADAGGAAGGADGGVGALSLMALSYHEPRAADLW
ncbi:MAG: hypothetical protein U0234_26445 [Sandaracinus sp.]